MGATVWRRRWGTRLTEADRVGTPIEAFDQLRAAVLADHPALNLRPLSAGWTSGTRLTDGLHRPPPRHGRA
jgi:hypothetical protein